MSFVPNRFYSTNTGKIDMYKGTRDSNVLPLECYGGNYSLNGHNALINAPINIDDINLTIDYNPTEKKVVVSCEYFEEKEFEFAYAIIQKPEITQ